MRSETRSCHDRSAHAVRISRRVWCGRHGEAEHECRLRVDDEFELARLHNRQICRLRHWWAPVAIITGWRMAHSHMPRCAISKLPAACENQGGTGKRFGEREVVCVSEHSCETIGRR